MKFLYFNVKSNSKLILKPFSCFFLYQIGCVYINRTFLPVLNEKFIASDCCNDLNSQILMKFSKIQKYNFSRYLIVSIWNYINIYQKYFHLFRQNSHFYYLHYKCYENLMTLDYLIINHGAKYSKLIILV